ncbi:MAG: class I SAM-dependent methyltransferase [Thermoleophilia bacterium]|nr:class I SAM-dependent methyltransferase [Gaiellaceae bacterium]MDW8338901.1 class I SAM-dependent methyltransferase [Thermoleophilia bacterium]
MENLPLREKYARHAGEWSRHSYADPQTYLSRRAELTVSLGPRLEPGDLVLDLGCGDAGVADFLLARGVRYRGVDLVPEMVAAARERLDGLAEVEVGDVNDYTPSEPVAATTVFRAIMFVRDRRAFFRRVTEFTQKKLVFDLNPRQFPLEGVVADLRAAGLGTIALTPFFVPTSVSLPSPARALAQALERSGPLARLVLRFRFSYLVAASRSPSS